MKFLACCLVTNLSTLYCNHYRSVLYVNLFGVKVFVNFELSLFTVVACKLLSGVCACGIEDVGSK